jgi:acyl-CoA thioester hydrolase
VRSWLARLGTRSFTVRQELIQDDEVAIRADAVCVLFDFGTGSTRPMSDDERDHWSRYLDE